MATYLITQATGQQSRWTITHLLAAGAKVHAVVRDLQKVPPALQHPDITLFQGLGENFDDIFRAAQGCKGVFLNTYPIPGLEALQAKTIVEACRKAGVETVVAATTFTTANKALWDNDVTKEMGLHQYWVSKAEVEDHVRGGGFQAYTILRPAVLHHDYCLPGSLGNFPRLSTHAEIDDILVGDAKLPHTDTHDVGKYAAAALQDPAKFGGQEIELGTGFYTLQETAEIVTRVSGREVRSVKRTPAELEEMGISVFGQKFQLWANILDFSPFANVAEIETKFGIPLTSLEEALRRDKDSLLKSLPAN